MKAKTGAILLFFGALCSCSYPIRLIAVIETEDAVYGKTKIEKAQKYDTRNRREPLTFSEAVMGSINSDSLNNLPQASTSQGQSLDDVVPVIINKP